MILTMDAGVQDIRGTHWSKHCFLAISATALLVAAIGLAALAAFVYRGNITPSQGIVMGAIGLICVATLIGFCAQVARYQFEKYVADPNQE